MISFKAAEYKFDANILLQEPAKNAKGTLYLASLYKLVTCF